MLRRERDEALILRTADGTERALFERHERDYGYGSLVLPSQRRYQVSPDARVLAYVDPGARVLHVLRRDGEKATIERVDRDDLRFSPDGASLFVAREERIERVDLRRMEVRPWADVHAPTWIEPCAEGLVVAHGRQGGGGAISVVRPDGPATSLCEGDWPMGRFTAAAAGTRVVYATRDGAFSLQSPEATPALLSREAAGVDNMEMTPDGGAVAFVTASGMIVQEGDAPLQRLGRDEGIHTVWYSRDGAELAWASPDVAVWRREGIERRLVPGPDEGRIAAMRFLRSGPGLLVSRGREVVRWSPERGDREVLARVDEGWELLGADAFDGGLVLWKARPWLDHPRGM